MPDLAPAIDMQIEMLELHRRIQARVSTPAAAPLAERQRRLAQGYRVVDWPEVPIEWADARLAVRQVADILNRHDLVDPADHRRLVAFVRDDAGIEAMAAGWYAETAQGPDTVATGPARPALLDELLPLAFKPYIARAAEVSRQQLDLTAWHRPWCPFCGASPEFSVIQEDESRLLMCGRCAARWQWLAVGCPWCGLEDSRRLPSFTSADRRYRVCACDGCRRYLKAYNAKGASRPVLPEVDVIATLPLDAAANQRGYSGG